MYIELFHADCRDVFHDTFRPSVLITDPPYSRHVHKNASTMRGGTARKRDLGFNYLRPDLRRWIARLVARTDYWSVIYSDDKINWLWHLAIRAACGRKETVQHIRSLPIVDSDDAALGSIPWIRWSMPQLSADRPPQGFEFVNLYHPKGYKTWNGPGNLVALNHKCLRGLDKHTTEKPLDQALDLVYFFSNPGEIVADPCAGRGTVGVACAVLGRQYVGTEIDGYEAEEAHKRIEQAKLGRFSESDEKRIERWLTSHSG